MRYTAIIEDDQQEVKIYCFSCEIERDILNTFVDKHGKIKCGFCGADLGFPSDLPEWARRKLLWQ